ncbi:unnamed protein product [Pseudo-nitzschia multistriata]|uniref:Uncharacterized protein n=1 Tax=Pseudo-nitzschia multistriata TaxID=183589 RepID=A0A448Z025_9STRA|nr:unnamed protein product [Pseudo-nitzschia multistriata]
MKRSLPLPPCVPRTRLRRVATKQMIAILLIVVHIQSALGSKRHSRLFSNHFHQGTHNEELLDGIGHCRRNISSGILIGIPRTLDQKSYALRGGGSAIKSTSRDPYRNESRPSSDSDNNSRYFPQTITVRVTTLHVPSILSEFGSVCKNTLLPVAKEVAFVCRDRLLPFAMEARDQALDRIRHCNYTTQRKTEVQTALPPAPEPLERNKEWRKSAEQTSGTEKRTRTRTAGWRRRNADEKLKPRKNGIRVRNQSSSMDDQQSYAARSQLESAGAFRSSSFRPASSITTALLPSRVLKLSLIAIALTEALDRMGILCVCLELPSVIGAEIRAVWRRSILPLAALIRRKLSSISLDWWKPRWKTIYHGWLEPSTQSLFEAVQTTNAKRFVGSLVETLSTTKAVFAFGTAAGMIAIPLVWTITLRFWKAVLVVVVLSEANRSFKYRRGRSLVWVLGDTPYTLGMALDGALEECAWLMRFCAAYASTLPERWAVGRVEAVDTPVGDGLPRMQIIRPLRPPCVDYRDDCDLDSDDVPYSLGIASSSVAKQQPRGPLSSIQRFRARMAFHVWKFRCWLANRLEDHYASYYSEEYDYSSNSRRIVPTGNNHDYYYK